ncbi:MAG: phospholipid transport system substrate-binding protein [Lentimonas sp.]|jgi:phospholipid transport system substrate-binding protein
MKYLSTVLLFVFTAACSHVLAAVGPAQQLKDTIKHSLDVIYGESYASASLEEKQRLIRDVVEQEYNLDILIRRAIGRNWDFIREDEQPQVLELVKQLVVKAYINGLNGHARPKLSFGQTVVVLDKRMEVPSVVVTEDNTINVLYRLGLMQSGWEIYDIVAEDISVVSNYRQQFDDHFRQGNGAELIKKLKDLLGREELDATIEL